MANRFQWKSSYSVGNPVLDEQHQKLLALCEEATKYEDVMDSDGAERYFAILTELSYYLGTHFQTEEALLRECNYPRLAEHIAEHNEARKRFHEFVYAAGRGALDRHVLREYLADWWRHHILGSDMRYRDYLR